MVQLYTIAGKQVGSHVLAMITLGSVFGGSAFLLRGGSAPKKTAQGPPITASSPDEESFIKDFLKNADEGAKKEQKVA